MRSKSRQPTASLPRLCFVPSEKASDTKSLDQAFSPGPQTCKLSCTHQPELTAPVNSGKYALEGIPDLWLGMLASWPEKNFQSCAKK
ncbi:Archaeal Glu-tRNAGln amidotransferase subunit E [Pseudomonas syringae pv. actinidiae]|uniref:Archaeal Glu-tRNAGln amidotransferase subunit E n=1 Tax=Pseudomonas syringae pv. actinidiae TaxID=103796 RepID=A0AAN4QDY0_PSESF|nr:Archaeal Glu-tRNAGln amidotransferase subunit E [Pseudomonas syringae pv. actinidiae]